MPDVMVAPEHPEQLICPPSASAPCGAQEPSPHQAETGMIQDITTALNTLKHRK